MTENKPTDKDIELDAWKRQVAELSLPEVHRSIFVPGSHYLLVIRILRLFRIFRLLKLSEYLMEADTLRRALRASRRKISVFSLPWCCLSLSSVH